MSRGSGSRWPRVASRRPGAPTIRPSKNTRPEPRLFERNPDAIPERDVEKAKTLVEARKGALDAAIATKTSTEAEVNTLLPAQKASAQAELEEATAELAKTTVYAGVTGRLEQFTLRPGDLVNPIMRPAGILIPSEAGRIGLQAGFNQIEAQVIRRGMIGEAACASVPFKIIPLVVTEVQSVIAAGQLRPTDQLVDPMQAPRPGALTAYLEPLFADGLGTLPPREQLRGQRLHQQPRKAAVARCRHH